MKFEEPKVEVVALETEVFTAAGSCTDSIMCQEYGVETCLGNAPMNNCNDEVDWL